MNTNNTPNEVAHLFNAPHHLCVQACKIELCLLFEHDELRRDLDNQLVVK
ncbi:MAG: hypothetical protein Q8O99_02460 [bacterium]|nr:hypothetical protein [bacterium]